MSLTEKIKNILFEDSYNKYGSEYMSHPVAEEDQLTIHAELPIAPSAHANMQLTDSAPPVDDDVYVPVNNKELGSALTALALKVPDNFVGNIYRQVKATIVAAEQSAATLTTEPDEAQPEEEISDRPINRSGLTPLAAARAAAASFGLFLYSQRPRRRPSIERMAAASAISLSLQSTSK